MKEIIFVPKAFKEYQDWILMIEKLRCELEIW